MRGNGGDVDAAVERRWRARAAGARRGSVRREGWCAREHRAVTEPADAVAGAFLGRAVFRACVPHGGVATVMLPANSKGPLLDYLHRRRGCAATRWGRHIRGGGDALVPHPGAGADLGEGVDGSGQRARAPSTCSWSQASKRASSTIRFKRSENGWPARRAKSLGRRGPRAAARPQRGAHAWQATGEGLSSALRSATLRHTGRGVAAGGRCRRASGATGH